MTNGVGIYARYSTDMQREASIEDQARVCERLIRETLNNFLQFCYNIFII